jgi:hypothetical protein
VRNRNDIYTGLTARRLPRNTIELPEWVGHGTHRPHRVRIHHRRQDPITAARGATAAETLPFPAEKTRKVIPRAVHKARPASLPEFS